MTNDRFAGARRRVRHGNLSSVICHLSFRRAVSAVALQPNVKPASIIKNVETSPAYFLRIETETGNWRRDRKGQAMKIESHHLMFARKLAACGLACSAVTLSFLVGYGIRTLVIEGIGLMFRHWHSYLSLLSC